MSCITWLSFSAGSPYMMGKSLPLWWFEWEMSPIVWHLNISLQLVALFGEAREVWPCWRKCVWPSRQALRLHHFQFCSALHACSSRYKPWASYSTTLSWLWPLGFWPWAASSPDKLALTEVLYCSPTGFPWLSLSLSRMPCESDLTLVVLGFSPRGLPCCATLTVLIVTEALLLVGFIIFLTFPQKAFLALFSFPLMFVW